MMLEYIRMVSYAMVVIVSIFSLPYTCSHRFLVVANIIMGSGSFLAVFHTTVLGVDPALIRNVLLTPASMFWAALVFISFIRR